MRARAVLQVFQDRHDGFNNGRIALGIHDIGKALGNQNHGANARAVAELIEKGFLECISDADRKQGKVREYRLTFISTGRTKDIAKATHEYQDWRPEAGKNRKFGGAKTATQKGISGAETTTVMKVSVANIAPAETESRDFCSPPSGAETALLIYNQSPGSFVAPESPPCSLEKLRRADPRTDVDELRDWTQAVVSQLGYGGARRLAHNAAIPEVALSRFRAGRGLPDQYRLQLQEACGRLLPYRQFREAA